MKRFATISMTWSLAFLVTMALASAHEGAATQDAEREGPYLGVTIAPSPGGSPLVLRVQRGSPGDQAGMQHGDFILSVAGDEIDSPEKLKQAINSQKVGKPFVMTTWRAGEKRSLEIVLRNGDQAASQDQLESRAWLGIMVRQSEHGGAEIARVYVGSPADEAGLQVGDRISQINGKDITSPKSVSQHVKALDTGDRAELVIDREGEQQSIVVTVGNLEDFHERLFGKRFRSKFDDSHEMFDPDFDGVPEQFFGIEGEDLGELIREMLHELKEFREEVRSVNGNDEV